MKLIAPLLLLFSSYASALEVDQFRVGLTAGQVFMLRDLGSTAGNALGFGIDGQYQINESLALEGQYLASTHTNLTHNELNFGVNYFFENEVYYPHITGGVSFISNKLTVANAPSSFSNSGLGIYFGGGIDFSVSEKLWVGFQLRYCKAFDVNMQDSYNNRQVAVVQDFATLLIHLLFNL